MLFNLDDKRINGLVLADFQKAFDLVSQDILIEKLCTYMYGLDECKAPWVLRAPSLQPQAVHSHQWKCTSLVPDSHAWSTTGVCTISTTFPGIYKQPSQGDVATNQSWHLCR